MNDQPIVIVGGGLAAGTAVTSLRERGYDGPIVLFTEEQHLPYERPPLSKAYLMGNDPAEKALVHDADWYSEHDVDVRTGTRVDAIDTEKRTVTAGGSEIGYRGLLLATGATARHLAIADHSGADVHYLRTLDGTLPTHLAILHAAASLFRGAGYTPFDGAAPTETMQAAVGAPYAHVTAPLRRLVDRFGLVICEAHSTGAEVPGWPREALPELPKIMARSSNTANRLDRMTLDAVEAALLAPRIGAEFDAVVLSAGGMSGSDKNDGGTVQLTDPAVEAVCDGHLEPGTDVRVRLVEADIATGTVQFVLAQ